MPTRFTFLIPPLMLVAVVLAYGNESAMPETVAIEHVADARHPARAANCQDCQLPLSATSREPETQEALILARH
jgi:hypothetical protein